MSHSNRSWKRCPETRTILSADDTCLRTVLGTTTVKRVSWSSQTDGGLVWVSAKLQVQTTVYTVSLPVQVPLGVLGGIESEDIRHAFQMILAIKYYLWKNPTLQLGETLPLGGTLNSVESMGELNHASLVGTKVG